MLDDWSSLGFSHSDINKSTTSQERAQQATESCSKFFVEDHFPAPSDAANVHYRRLLKRPRFHEDVDGEYEHTQRKKRRLRLELFTSRLSRPYATPATHIIGTQAGRAGAWARQRFAGGKLLRKAALLNWTSKNNKEDPPAATKTNGCSSTAPGLRLQYLTTARPSAQLVPSASATFQMPCDYDAFDHEEDDIDRDTEEEDEDDDGLSSDEESEAIHSDFRRLESSDTDPDFFDTSWSFGEIDGGNSEVGHDGTELKHVMENESQDEVSIAPTKPDAFPSLHGRIRVVGI